jgi:hypothetical protein
MSILQAPFVGVVMGYGSVPRSQGGEGGTGNQQQRQVVDVG